MVDHAGTDFGDLATVVVGAGTLDALVAEEYGHVFSYAYSLTRDRDVAADVVQEAFARLVARWVGVRDPKAYLFRITTNLVRAEWKRRGRPVPEHEPAPASDTTEQLSMRQAIATLPRRQREVIFLRYYADLTLGDIAAVMGRPEGTIKSLHHHARRRLATILERSHG